MSALTTTMPTTTPMSERTLDDTAAPELMRVILEGLREGVVATDASGNIVYANRASRELVGTSLMGVDEVSRQAKAQPLHEDRVTPVSFDEAPLVRALRGENVDNMVQWIRVGPDDREILVTVNATPLRDASGTITGAVAWFRDITASKDLENELRRRALTDPLTGAFNRRHGHERLAAELLRHGRYGNRASILLIDVDHFKSVNDHHGHAAGDTALCAFVTLCSGELRGADTIVRWGGEEFLVILPETDAAGGAATAERLRAVVAETPIALQGGASIRLTVSIGVAQAGGGDLDELLRRADAALYEAKARGRDQVVVAKPAIA
jgi:diguanylate cyclase (GGDEF)-like protein/PAS domain S-box-containing protein